MPNTGSHTELEPPLPPVADRAGPSSRASSFRFGLKRGSFPSHLHGFGSHHHVPPEKRVQANSRGSVPNRSGRPSVSVRWTRSSPRLPRLPHKKHRENAAKKTQLASMTRMGKREKTEARSPCDWPTRFREARAGGGSSCRSCGLGPRAEVVAVVGRGLRRSGC